MPELNSLGVKIVPSQSKIPPAKLCINAAGTGGALESWVTGLKDDINPNFDVAEVVGTLGSAC